MDTIILRRDAAARALPKYFTGKPCSRGHVAQRYTKTGVCCSCAVESARQHNSRVNRQVAAKRGELIVYKLADEADFGAAWAYLQGLDLARGAVPQPNPRGPHEPSTPAVDPAIAAQIQAQRRKELGAAADGPIVGATVLDAGMAAQLGGLLK